MAINTTISTATQAAFNKQFYDKKLLETAKTHLVHASFGQKRSIPATAASAWNSASTTCSRPIRTR